MSIILYIWCPFMTSWTCSFGESIHHTFDYAGLCDNNAHTNKHIYIYDKSCITILILCYCLIVFRYNISLCIQPYLPMIWGFKFIDPWGLPLYRYRSRSLFLHRHRGTYIHTYIHINIRYIWGGIGFVDLIHILYLYEFVDLLMELSACVCCCSLIAKFWTKMAPESSHDTATWQREGISLMAVQQWVKSQVNSERDYIMVFNHPP